MKTKEKNLKEEQLEFAMNQLAELGEKALEKSEEIKKEIKSQKPSISIEEIEENFEVEIVDIFPSSQKPTKSGTVMIHIKIKQLPFQFGFTVANIRFHLKKEIEEIRKIEEYINLKKYICITWPFVFYRTISSYSPSIRFPRCFRRYIKKIIRYEILEHF